ncbi:MAG: nitrite reductase small subunit NirD [Algibacter sp.]|uniref:nitrite reductase small subunit NirD n=1 Tax=Algibacter sp. TaxID=1872428 RepID=UPI00329913D7
MNSIATKYKTVKSDEVNVWFKAANINDFPKDGGACVKYKDLQIAVFNFNRLKTWYACQNLSPYKEEMVLSRGMIGDHNGEPMVACPLHKKTYSLETGENLNGDLEPIALYPIKIEGENVYIGFSE